MRHPPALLAAAGLLAAGCASTSYRGVSAAEARAAGWERVEGVPEVRQETQQGCGAAALAMVLGHWGRSVAQAEILAATPPPDGQGLRADALRDFARGRGLQAFLVQGEPADLHREVARNRPVVVGLLKRQGRRLVPHYEVVVGLDRARRRVLLLDPARGPRETGFEPFQRDWSAAGRVTLVVFPAQPAPEPSVNTPARDGRAP